MVITEIKTDLFDDAISDERRDGVADGLKPARGHSRGDADHVGLGHPAVEKASGGNLFEFVEQPVPDVAGEQDDVLALMRDLGDLVGESVAHCRKLK